MMSIEIKKSVREFVELVLKSGSLDNRFTTNVRAIEGVRAHQKLQKSNEKLYKKYEKEVYLKTDIYMEHFTLHLDGRCDGIIEDNNDVIVEEIKSTYVPLVDIYEDFNIMHWCQGKIYAYILCKDRGLENIYVQLSYYNLDTDEVKSFLKKFSYDDLKLYVEELVSIYKKYIELDINHKQKRNESIKKVKFPFESYRKGQLDLIKACYGTVRDEKIIFLQAPTGTGKTISTLYSSIKALREGYGEKIFYLTAKNINRRVAEDTIGKLVKQNLKLKTISILAKEKMCINNVFSCNEEECIYAKKYYDKLKNVLLNILEDSEEFSTDKLLEYGKKYEVCPFELGLDLIEWCDCVICDYNYIFDPKVYLRRICDENGESNIVLVDEAHNLVDRARNNYSAKLFKSKFISLKKEVRGVIPKLYKHINKVMRLFVEEESSFEFEKRKYINYNEIPKEICKELRLINREIEDILSRKDKLSFNELLLEVYFDISNFLNISELYDDKYTTYVQKDKNELIIALFCIDPASKLRETMNKFRSVVLFSATLSPFEYFIRILGGNKDDYRLKLKSPFPEENINVYLYKGNTRYVAREKTLSEICKKIFKFINMVKGNYLVFFPSYEYLSLAKKHIEENYNYNNILFQDSIMNDNERSDFISQFTEESNIVAFCVLGGLFSEGIDLPGSRLIGTVIVGIGYPKISLEGNLIKSYFKEDGEKVAYIYPGMNKVMQAGGRVIRSESDKGNILLIDDRYLNKQYYELLPGEWKPLINIK
ncbi:MAG: ATP-dependent DNA helicase [Clostridium sp.]|nr:ATP-dependent DNA helicase [Clostridium sp.]